ncbi:MULTISPECIES: putidacin L1 family lectin-like bacteriocin [Pseudomonas]|uniref:Bulb-type lectin domain-containing protein n=1 Tax=Pseudomonas savastanoi TaxID=29438 RepID=A0AAW3LZ09_PSESS|nr:MULTISPECIES: putidacin L1 family lectin-like bacteriocin [Pseudomonas]KTB72916.1 hypothetical protein AO068_23780 [Pseudomonas sp. ICMP 3272]KTC56259.1 hypothetical protein AO258_23670 [Pseudomonas syringae ICMP 19498]KTC58594.1 hypothetical protein AO287_02140 [Pseudomonas savastanoi]MDU8458104.1 putidacin L1 family lectin-like bacteriocin [Pseudomonas syringae group sp. J254-4]
MPAYYPKHTDSFVQVGASKMPALQTLVQGQYLLSPNGKYQLLLQDDANLAIYDRETGKAVWIADGNQQYSQTVALEGPIGMHLLTNGNIYLYDPIRGRVWSTRNLYDAIERTQLSIQDDGNLVVLDIRALWSSNGRLAFTPGAFDAKVLNADQSMQIAVPYPAGEFKLIFQADGNLVVYDRDMKAVWNAGTHNKGATRAVMQSDGNFVIYTDAGVAIWNTGTQGNPGAYAQIQSNGAFVIVQDKPVWARFGWAPEPVRPPRRVFYPDHSTGPLPLFGGVGWDF